jgi:hypothetical protein
VSEREREATERASCLSRTPSVAPLRDWEGMRQGHHGARDLCTDLRASRTTPSLRLARCAWVAGEGEREREGGGREGRGGCLGMQCQSTRARWAVVRCGRRFSVVCQLRSVVVEGRWRAEGEERREHSFLPSLSLSLFPFPPPHHSKTKHLAALTTLYSTSLHPYLSPRAFSRSIAHRFTTQIDRRPREEKHTDSKNREKRSSLSRRTPTTTHRRGKNAVPQRHRDAPAGGAPHGGGRPASRGRARR